MARRVSRGRIALQPLGASPYSLPAWPIVLAFVGILLGTAFLWWTMARGARAAPTQVIVVPESAVVARPPLANDARDIKPNRLPEYAPRDFQQVGLLTSDEADKDPLMLPLYGKRLDRRDRWQYYAAGDKPTHLWRLPMSVNKRDCSEDLGCNEIYNGDVVEVPVYKDRLFTAHMYRLNAFTYDNRPPSF